MALPPLLAGGENVTVACVFPAVADTFSGAVGNGSGVTLLDGADATLLPKEFAAVAVNVYAVKFARPVMKWFRAVVPACASMPPAGFEVTVYPLIAAPPLTADAEKVTVATALPGLAATPVGALGTVPGVTLLDAAEAALAPITLFAITVKV